MIQARLTVTQIIDATARADGFTVQALLSDLTWSGITRCRHRAMYLARRLRPDQSYPVLGRAFLRHHTSVVNGVSRTAWRLVTGELDERVAVNRVLKRLGVEFLPYTEEDAREFAALSRREALLAVELDRVRERLSALREAAHG